MKRIIILAGGYSKEREISKASAHSIYKTLKKKYKILVCEPDNKLIYKIKKFRPDVVYNSLHGRFGEDAQVWHVLENGSCVSTCVCETCARLVWELACDGKGSSTKASSP